MNVPELERLLVRESETYAILVTDEEGTVLTWNRGAERMFGWKEHEMIGTPADRIFTPEDRADGVPDAERARARRTGIAPDDRWHLRRDGSRLWVDGVQTALRTPDGRFVAFAKIVRDNTEGRELLEALQASERKLQAVARTIPDMMWTSKNDGSIDYINERWTAYTGQAPEGAFGRGWLESIHPDDRERTADAWSAAVQRTADDGVLPYEVEHRIRTADGSYRWFLSRALPVRAAHGDIVGWTGTSTDVHEARQLARALEARAKQQHAVAELGRFALGDRSIDDIMGEASRCACENTGADFCKILRYHHEGRHLRLQAGVGWDEGAAGAHIVPLERTAAGYALERQEVVIVEDFREEDRFVRSTLLERHDVVCCITAPIGGVERPYGVITSCSRTPRAFPQDDIDFLQSIANILAESLRRRALETERARLELERELGEGLERERRKIGRELHDGVRQQLVGVRMLAASLQRRLEAQGSSDAALMQEFSELLGDANLAVRELINGLVPPRIDRAFLAGALERLGRNTEQWYGVQCAVTVSTPADGLSDEAANHLYYIAQEAVTNAARHARPTCIDLMLRSDERGLTLVVHDDGSGLPDDYDSRGSHGFSGMRGRAELVGATLEVASAPRSGTTITCRIPGAVPGTPLDGDAVDS